ncbi:MAG TPA: helicase C-terminal domain-containing protein [Tepidisphaeraceae bacterium]
MITTLDEILGPNGAIARRMGERYEHRPQQLEMAAAVEEALQGRKHLLVEAGTGVGKSFAYLLPAIDYAVKNKKRVVISTHTISLQEQLIDKDIPLLQSVYPDEFTAVLVKGRSNYLCQRRLKQARGRQGYLFDQSRQIESLRLIEEWAAESVEKGGLGSLSEMPNVPEPDVWDKVCAEQGNCLGKKCEFFKNCFWQDAKRRMSSGNILVVNHALFFSDLALRAVGVNYLPKYEVAILDEAHTLEDVAGQHFGLKFSEAGLKYLLRSLYDPKRGRGMLNVHGSIANAAISDVIDLHQIGEQFFTRCLGWQQSFGRSNGRIREANVVENDLTPKLRELDLHIKAILPTLKDDEEISELTSISGKVSAMSESVDAILAQKMGDAVYWMEVAGRSPQRVTLHASPVDMAEGLRRHLFSKVASVVMCSATLCTRGNGGDSFDYIRKRLGADDCKEVRLGSPFDYAKQATLYVEPNLPEPSDPMFMKPACEKILQYLKQTEGGAFVLFTSYKSLIETANRLKGGIEAMGLPMLVQGQGATRRILLERFRANSRSVLFGTSSFWQGIDVQGDALRNVIIVKLPFAVPDEPIVEARLDAITKAGGNAFMEYSVPEAIIKLKQGVGRLIRSRTDTGIIVVLDSRVKTKRYGRLFLESLPSCRVVEKE